MSHAKTVLLIDEAMIATMKAEAVERAADRDAMLKLLEQEINELHQIISELKLRIETLEGGGTSSGSQS